MRSITPFPFGTGEREEKVYISRVARLLGGVDGAGGKSALKRLLFGDVRPPFT